MLSFKAQGIGNILSALEDYPMTSVVKFFCKHNNVVVQNQNVHDYSRSTIAG
jgi:hypothetical protein